MLRGELRVSKIIKEHKPQSSTNTENNQAKNSVNEGIRSDAIMVIDEEGKNHGVLSKRQALALAEECSSDLVQVGEKEGVVIAKIMDYGKFLYTKKKQLNDAKKNQKVIAVKELKLRPHIGDQDYFTKMNKAVEFFLNGDKVKFTLQFKGREVIMMADLGKKFFERIEQDLAKRELGGVLTYEKESKAGSLWTKIYFVRTTT